jgi:DNA-binding NtrC family response regulator
MNISRGLLKFFRGLRVANVSLPRKLPMVAVLTGGLAADGDRATLSETAASAHLDLQVARSCDEAWHVAGRLRAPVIAYDRDIQDTEWREAVGMLSALPHRPILILISPVADEYLWNELCRIGGFDVLRKPLRADDVSRVLAQALLYWRSEAWRGEAPASAKQTG